MSLEQAKILAQELGLDERKWEREESDDGEGAILARDFGLHGQTPPEDKPLDLITEEILFYSARPAAPSSRSASGCWRQNPS